ncbi:MAG TPA: hypothetical protein VIT23_05170 [Terrimicrobiaceae bacterium]
MPFYLTSDISTALVHFLPRFLPPANLDKAPWPNLCKSWNFVLAARESVGLAYFNRATAKDLEVLPAVESTGFLAVGCLLAAVLSCPVCFSGSGRWRETS